MIVQEAVAKYEDNPMISIIIRTKDNKLKSASCMNYLGGVCDCCKEHYHFDDMTVHKIVDLNTLEVIYEED